MTYFNSPEALREWFAKYREDNPELYKSYINKYKKKAVSHMFREELEEQ
tara:strand:+ start:670 stop:816 length:147 start_codon:yes stop_codon:yes gene_type:complete